MKSNTLQEVTSDIINTENNPIPALNKNLISQGKKISMPHVVDVIITLYSNGFCINNAPFRSFDFIDNYEFIQTIARNQLPQEIIRSYNKDVDIGIVDRSNEEYSIVPTKITEIDESTLKCHTYNGILTYIKCRLPDANIKIYELRSSTPLHVVASALQSKLNCGHIYLLAGFPPKLLPNDGTIQGFNLMKSTIIVRV